MRIQIQRNTTLLLVSINTQLGDATNSRMKSTRGGLNKMHFDDKMKFNCQAQKKKTKWSIICFYKTKVRSSCKNFSKKFTILTPTPFLFLEIKILRMLKVRRLRRCLLLCKALFSLAHRKEG